jgi:NTE family protein
MWADAVFEGGGVKGIGLVGALQVLEEKGYRFKRVAGTSAGALIAALVAAGYTAQELYEILLKKDFQELLVPRSRWPWIRTALRVWWKKGIYSGNAYEKWVEELLLKKGIQTFADFKETELYVIASDISQNKLLVIPDDLESYGYQADQFSVARAIRMSSSIPYFFEPVKWMDRTSQTECYIVDGGVLSNYPIWIFDREVPRWPTFGFRLISTERKVNQIDGPLSMFMSILLTMLDAHDNRAIDSQECVRTVMVPASGIKMIDFDINQDKKKKLYRSGQQAARKFFEHWSFEEYLRARGKWSGGRRN